MQDNNLVLGVANVELNIRLEIVRKIGATYNVYENTLYRQTENKDGDGSD